MFFSNELVKKRSWQPKKSLSKGANYLEFATPKKIGGMPNVTRASPTLQSLQGFKNVFRMTFPPTNEPNVQERFNKASARVAKSSQSCSDHSEPPAHGNPWESMGILRGPPPPPNVTPNMKKIRPYVRGYLGMMLADDPLNQALFFGEGGIGGVLLHSHHSKRSPVWKTE